MLQRSQVGSMSNTMEPWLGTGGKIDMSAEDEKRNTGGGKGKEAHNGGSRGLGKEEGSGATIRSGEGEDRKRKDKREAENQRVAGASMNGGGEMNADEMELEKGDGSSEGQEESGSEKSESNMKVLKKSKRAQWRILGYKSRKERTKQNGGRKQRMVHICQMKSVG